jgi:two-component system chemotaxis response regulator CheY
VSDLNMPGMSGIELVGELRRLPAYRSIPILMLTTETSDDMKSRARSAGASGWIVKPFDPERLIGIVNRLLGNRPS